MSVATNIVATYRRPGAVVRRLLADGPREDRALAMLMGACTLTFVSQWPVLSRQAHLNGEELNPMLGGALFGWLFVAPLLFYALAAIGHGVARLLGGKGTWGAARIALFWSFLASTPLILLNGLTAGLVGTGPALSLVGLAWCAAFLWFWIAGMIVAEEGA
ncbi:YIP1 family protein [Roseivivax marinus]|uniref:YIP1 family protein n=1 Tax=Roseivivax marinus TaxID=1379903 RepID=UPI00273FAA03|nr:YIP1 family protein [Roseivivax marinus]